MHSVLHGFFMGPVTVRAQMTLFIDERQSSLPIETLLLTTEQLIENEYPVPSWISDVIQLDESWLQIPMCAEDTHECQTLALDCEMCITSAGKELAHICVVDYKTGAKLYDQLVQPSAPIVDYLTRFSGITEASLEGITTTLTDVQKFLSTLIKPSTILLGHSLESDLRAMKVAHGRCIDTSIIYHHPRGRPLKPGLKWLMKKWAGKDIQTRGDGGHDPEEDARACVELLNLKLVNGLGFGHFMVDMENILERMRRSDGKQIRTGVVDYGTPATWLGSKATSTFACSNDDDVVKGIQDMVGSHQFIFGRMLELSEGLGWTTKKALLASASLSAPPLVEAIDSPVVEPPSSDELYRSLNERLSTLYQSLPTATAFVLFSGHDDPRRMAAMSNKKTAFENAIREGKTLDNIPKEEWWTSQEGRELEAEVEKVKKGLLFLGIK
ncbi:hypothetical protein FRC17_005619 [Serendipita sp. 399]|nr:hypothetical protein FRC17_005619 [Serendipita sp. 399]